MTSQLIVWYTMCNIMRTMAMMVICKNSYFVFFCILIKIEFNNIQKYSNNPQPTKQPSRHVVSK